MPQKTKCSKREVEERKEVVYAMMLDGYSHNAICRYGSDKWDIGPRQIEHYITKINRDLAERTRENIDERRERAIDRCKRFLIKCIEKNDYRTAATMIKEINEIEGVKTIRHEHSGQVQVTHRAMVEYMENLTRVNSEAAAVKLLDAPEDSTGEEE